jgi:hypothetical protein
MKVELKKVKRAYHRAKETGMFWEFHPELTGNWNDDKEDYIEFVEKYWNWELIDNG